MKNDPTYEQARDLMLSAIRPVGAETVELSQSSGRILAERLAALTDSPSFDNSPYDGYAFRAADSSTALPQSPVTLKIIEEIPAGSHSLQKVIPGTAAKILTGAPIPEGADTVTKYEITRFDHESVSIFQPALPGDNIIKAGEDVKRGTVLGFMGQTIDAALAGSLAAQGLDKIQVFRKPRVGIISTGNELAEPGQKAEGPLIYNSNRYMLEAVCLAAGAVPVYLGAARDQVEEIAALLSRGFADCDMLLSTGGVSVGDYDLTPAALEAAGAEVLVQGVRLKPGGACAYAQKNDKPAFCLSGRPASALVNFYAVALPTLRKLCGHSEPKLRQVKVELISGFPKSSPVTRIIRGQLDLSEGRVRMHVPQQQGNCVLHSLIGSEIMGIIPADSPPLKAGSIIDGYLLPLSPASPQ